MAVAVVPPVVPAPSPAPNAAGPAVDVAGTMLDVVAEKTGYPVEMLELDMALEADLGIDSIKRVEILAAVQARVPGLPEVDAGHMGSMRTLAENRGLHGGGHAWRGARGGACARPRSRDARRGG